MADEDLTKDEDDGRLFTPHERKILRKIIRGWERMVWLLSIVRTWAIWITGILAAVYAVLNAVRDSVKAVIGGGTP